MATLCCLAYLRRHAPSLLFLAAAVLASTSTPIDSLAQTPSPATPSPQRRPFDPLTREERERAARAANGDERARSLLTRGGRQRLITVELADDKPAEAERGRREGPDRPAQAGRVAEVIYFRYAANDGVRVLVDLASNRVRSVTQLDARGVPLSFEEIEEAAALALKNPQLRALLGPSADSYRAVRPDEEARDDENALRVEGLRLMTTSQQDPCWEHRCVSLLFRRGRSYLTYTDVTVDLTTQRVHVERRGRQ